MDIVRMRAGLGNQMFCYALYLELISRGREVGIDMGFYTKYPDWPDPYMLEHVFPNIKINPVEESLFDSICDKYKKESTEKGWSEYINYHPEKRYFWGENKKDVGCYLPDVFKTKECAFVGLWYSEKYFQHVKREVRTAFQFSRGEDKLIRLAEEMNRQNSVSLNIRLGRTYSYVDVTTPNGNQVANIAADGYYSRAISKMAETVGNDAKWYIFSDAIDVLNGKKDIASEVASFREKDITLTPGAENYRTSVDVLRKELNDLDKVYITADMFDRYEDWYDLFLMSNAKNNIIANSSFGWWGAWLNNNADKTVISPNRFFQSSECTDIYPDEWIRL